MGMVFWSDHSGGTVYANDAFTGEVLWTYDIPDYGWVDGGPTYCNGTVFIEDDVGQVTALDAFTGDMIWMSSFNYSFYSAVTVCDGIAYALDSGGVLHALDASTGEQLWSLRNWPVETPIMRLQWS